MVNAERSAAGIPELTWSEDLYNIAMERCHEDDGHASVRPGTGETARQVRLETTMQMQLRYIRTGRTARDTMTTT